MNNCLFIPLLTGLFTAIFGYFLGRLNSKKNDEKYLKLLNDYKKKVEELTQNINIEKAKIAELTDTNNRLEGTLFANAKNEILLKNKVTELEQNMVTLNKNNEQQFKNKIAALEQKLIQLATNNNKGSGL